MAEKARADAAELAIARLKESLKVSHWGRDISTQWPLSTACYTAVESKMLLRLSAILMAPSGCPCLGGFCTACMFADVPVSVLLFIQCIGDTHPHCTVCYMLLLTC
jgi:hypothetical protein